MSMLPSSDHDFILSFFFGNSVVVVSLVDSVQGDLVVS